MLIDKLTYYVSVEEEYGKLIFVNYSYYYYYIKLLFYDYTLIRVIANIKFIKLIL